LLPVDNQLLAFGAAQDATISYNGTNLVVNPKVVGTGMVVFSGDFGGTSGNALVVQNDNYAFKSYANPLAGLYFQTVPTGQFQFRDTLGKSIFAIATSTGNVGIDTNTPQNKLNIVGDINASQFINTDTNFRVGGTQGITDSSSYWLCTAADCSTKCQVSIKGGIIVGCS
jgi:hypothetical protein